MVTIAIDKWLDSVLLKLTHVHTHKHTHAQAYVASINHKQCHFKLHVSCFLNIMREESNTERERKKKKSVFICLSLHFPFCARMASRKQNPHFFFVLFFPMLQFYNYVLVSFVFVFALRFVCQMDIRLGYSVAIVVVVGFILKQKIKYNV